jgi:hypothetical protein
LSIGLALPIWLLGSAGPAAAVEGAVSASLLLRAQSRGNVRVIVQLDEWREARAEPAADAASARRAGIARSRAAVVAELGSASGVVREYETIPFVALSVSPADLAVLERSPHVIGVQEDRP